MFFGACNPLHAGCEICVFRIPGSGSGSVHKIPMRFRDIRENGPASVMKLLFKCCGRNVPPGRMQAGALLSD